jgi:hypothetical protein
MIGVLLILKRGLSFREFTKVRQEEGEKGRKAEEEKIH